MIPRELSRPPSPRAESKRVPVSEPHTPPPPLDVVTNRTGVLETIAAAVRDARAPSLPSPASGGGGVCRAGGAYGRADGVSQ